MSERPERSDTEQEPSGRDAASTIAPTIPLRTPEEIALRAGIDFPRLRLPERGSVFSDRAIRLRQLAAGHPMRDYLMLMAVVCEAQQALLDAGSASNAPRAAAGDGARGAPAQQGVAMATIAHGGETPFDVIHLPRDPAWRTQLGAMLDRVLAALPSAHPSRSAIDAVRRMDADRIEQQAERLLTGVTLNLDMAAAPLIAAGLQLWWTQLVTGPHAELASRNPDADPSRCPCCGSLPTASVVQIGGDRDGYRYLQCSLCSTQWHMVRVKCTHCQSTKGIHYQTLQDADADEDAASSHPGATSSTEPNANTRRSAVEAETCDECGHYLKLMHAARDPSIEVLADDLATLTLDLLVSEDGFQRHGTNLLLVFGDDPGEGHGDDPGGNSGGNSGSNSGGNPGREAPRRGHG